MMKIKQEQAEKREVYLTTFQKMVQEKKREKADLEKRIQEEGKLSFKELMAKAKREMEEAKNDPKLQETVLVRTDPEEPEWKPCKKADLVIDQAKEKQKKIEVKIKEKEEMD